MKTSTRLQRIPFLLLLAFAVASAANAQDSTWFKAITTQVGLDSIDNYFMCVADINGDDYPDIVLQAGVQTENQVRVFLNTRRSATGDAGDRLFVETTEVSGINGPGRIADLIGLADLDNDGDVDLVTATYFYTLKGPPDCTENPDNGGRCESYLNDGSGHFTLVPNNGLHDLGPIPGSGISFLDYDRDGRIDVFLATHFEDGFCLGLGSAKYLMRGRGDGTFEDASEASGISAYTSALFGVNAGDWNNDCNQDILTAIYGATGTGNLWRNNGDGTFTDVAGSSGYNPHFQSGDNGQAMVPWAAEPFDFDNDGDMDVLFMLVHGGSGAGEGRSTIFVNQGSAGDFKLVPDLARIVRRAPQSGHHGDNQGRFLDFNNDGLYDLVMSECVYVPASDRLYFLLQDSLHRFHDITDSLGFITGTSAATIKQIIKNPHAIEPIDFDLDGDDDFVCAKYPGDKRFLFLRNDVGSRNNWVAVKLVAPAGVNRSAIGARITVKSGALTLTRDIYAGQGNFCAQQPFILNFGLGARTAVDTIIVRWPDGSCSTTTVTNPPINRMLVIGRDGLQQSGTKADPEDDVTKLPLDLTRR